MPLCTATGVKQPIHADLWRVPDHPQPDSKFGPALAGVHRGCSDVICLL